MPLVDIILIIFMCLSILAMIPIWFSIFKDIINHLSSEKKFKRKMTLKSFSTLHSFRRRELREISQKLNLTEQEAIILAWDVFAMEFEEQSRQLSLTKLANLYKNTYIPFDIIFKDKQ